MSGMYGADVSSLRALAKKFDDVAEELSAIATDVTNQVAGQAMWKGPNAAEFRSVWHSSHRPNLTTSSSTLRDAAKKLRGNADAQERTSNEYVTGGGGGGNGGGNGGDSGAPGKQEEDPNPLPMPGADPFHKNDPNDPFSRSVHSSEPTTLSERHLTSNYGETGWTENKESTTTASEKGTFAVNLGEHKGGVFAGWQAGTEGQFGSDDGVHGKGAASASAGAGAEYSGTLSVSENGLVAEGKAGANAGVGAEASGEVGYGDHLKAEGKAEAFAGARAEATGGVSVGPHGAGASLGGEAFAGAEAKGEVAGTVAGVKAGAEGSVYAGAGIKGSADVNLGMDGIGVDLELGAALGVGAGFSVQVEVSPKDVVDAVKDVGGGIWDAVTPW